MKANWLRWLLLLLLASAAFQLSAQQSEVNRKLLADVRAKAEKGDAQSQCELGVAFALGRLGVPKDEVEAVKWWRKAAQGGDVNALNAFAWTLATSENSGIRDGSNAVVFAEKAVVAGNHKNAAELDTLAAAYAEVGQSEKAVRMEQEAIALLQTEAAKSDYRTRLKLYEAKVPDRAKN
jgi:uncharacterized protein